MKRIASRSKPPNGRPLIENRRPTAQRRFSPRRGETQPLVRRAGDKSAGAALVAVMQASDFSALRRLFRPCVAGSCGSPANPCRAKIRAGFSVVADVRGQEALQM